MFMEIAKEYLREDVPCPLALVVCNLGNSGNQSAVYRPNGFVWHHVIWVERGAGCFATQGKIQRLEAGQGMFCRSGIAHQYESCASEFATRWATFRGGEGVMEYYHAPDAFFFSVTDWFLSATEQLQSLCEGSGTVLSRSVAGYTWLSEWFGNQFAPAATLGERVLQYLETHFAEAVSLEDVAEALRVNRYVLCRQFAREKQSTVMDALRHIRVAKAKQYLRYTNVSVAEIGGMSGYYDPSYFGKIFREETGESPTEYRRRHGIIV